MNSDIDITRPDNHRSILNVTAVCEQNWLVHACSGDYSSTVLVAHLGIGTGVSKQWCDVWKCAVWPFKATIRLSSLFCTELCKQ